MLCAPWMKAEFIFSDDRRWLGRTADEASRIATAALSLADDACAPNNASKLTYAHIVLQASSSIQLQPSSSSYILGSIVKSNPQPPSVVGIPVLPNSFPSYLLAKLHLKASKMKQFIRRFTPHFLLASRCIRAYILSSLDYIARSVPICGSPITTIQRIVLSVFRCLLFASTDVPIYFLTTPISCFGWGCPLISVRCDLNFLHGYLLARSCRSVYVRRLLTLQNDAPLPLGQDDANHFSASRICMVCHPSRIHSAQSLFLLFQRLSSAVLSYTSPQTPGKRFTVTPCSPAGQGSGSLLPIRTFAPTAFGGGFWLFAHLPHI